MIVPINKTSEDTVIRWNMKMTTMVIITSTGLHGGVDGDDDDDDGRGR